MARSNASLASYQMLRFPSDFDYCDRDVIVLRLFLREGAHGKLEITDDLVGRHMAKNAHQVQGSLGAESGAVGRMGLDDAVGEKKNEIAWIKNNRRGAEEVAIG